MLVKLDHLPRNPGENKKSLKPPVTSIAPGWCCDSKAKYCCICPRSTKFDCKQINQISHLDYLVSSSQLLVPVIETGWGNVFFFKFRSGVFWKRHFFQSISGKLLTMGFSRLWIRVCCWPKPPSKLALPGILEGFSRWLFKWHVSLTRLFALLMVFLRAKKIKRSRLRAGWKKQLLGRGHYPYHPRMVYFPTFGWFWWQM